MPNWCQNNLKINGNGEKVLELLELLKDNEGNMTFEKLVPTPEELANEPSPQRDEKKAAEFTAKYGDADWYKWRLRNWGCKWDASESSFWKDGDDWVISFQTPWGPPSEFIAQLSEKFPNMTFVLQYADESECCAPLGQSTFKEGNEIEYIDEDENRQFARRVWAGEFVNLRKED